MGLSWPSRRPGEVPKLMATPAALRYIARIGFIDHAGKNSHIQFYVSAAAYAAWKTDTTAGILRDFLTAYEGESLDTVPGGRVGGKTLPLATPHPPPPDDPLNPPTRPLL